ncbi:MAG: SDR family oxidoreductase [Bacteroidales bacterium]|nr:SDR family oxidoreductase [Bacteroidales bacterium]
MNNPFSLTRKRILVTGASSGIGRTTAIECSRLGATMVLTGRDETRLQETMGALMGDGHSAIAADLTDSQSLAQLIERVGNLDGLVVCAGQGGVVPLKLASRQRLDPVFEINYFAPVELMRLLLKKKCINDGASIVFVASIGGIDSITIGNGVYGASKAAINSAMKFYAIELAPKKIRSNSVCPGMVNTGMIKGGAVSEEQHKTDMEKYPLKRYGEPEDVAYGIIYLLSDASSWVTGHSLVIDGGVTI